MATIYDRKVLFDGVRSLFRGNLSQSQVDGIEAIVAEGERRQLDLRSLAYVLATPWWETAQKMQPIPEYGSAAYFTRMYDINGSRPSVARTLGNIYPGDGAKFCGRGLAQVTGRTNYVWASKVLGHDCIADPDRLLKTEGAVPLLFEGMITGHFTGKKLGDYFAAGKTDWLNARRIINGMDKAAEIGKAAQGFYAALVKASRQGAVPPPPAPVAPASAPSAPAAGPATPLAKPGLFARLVIYFGRH